MLDTIVELIRSHGWHQTKTNRKPKCEAKNEQSRVLLYTMHSIVYVFKTLPHAAPPHGPPTQRDDSRLLHLGLTGHAGSSAVASAMVLSTPASCVDRSSLVSRCPYFLSRQ